MFLLFAARAHLLNLPQAMLKQSDFFFTDPRHPRGFKAEPSQESLQ